MPSPGALTPFALASFVLFLIPGPAVAYIVNRSLADGRRAALVSVAGLELGNLVQVVFAAVGLSALLATSATAFTAVKLLGAAYLVAIGVRTLLTRPGRLSGVVDPISDRRAFAHGVVVNTLNPKVALFFLSFLPQFIEPDHGPAWSQALVLGSVFVAMGCVMDSLWALLASGLRDLLLRGRAQMFVRRWVSGSLFVALGLIAARARRSAA